MKLRLNTMLKILILLMMVLFLISGCTKDSESKKEVVRENSTENIPISDETQISENSSDIEKPILYDIIISNMDKWEFACDQFTQMFTYDEVECFQLRLFTGDTKGEYYLSALYAATDTGGANTCQRAYYISNGKMDYEYSSVFSNDDFILNNYTILYTQTISLGDDKTQDVEKLVSEALLAEEKYYKEITLEDTQDIELTDEENKLYQNLYKAILELEYYESGYGVTDEWYSLVEIQCYDLGNGKCEVLMGYGGIWYGETNYISYGDKYTTTQIGYSINEDGYDELSYDEEERLRNTTNIITIDWNPDWTVEKKEYILKEAIHNTQ